MMDSETGEILSKFFSGEITTEEKEKLYAWLQASSEHRSEALHLYQQWQDANVGETFDADIGWRRFVEAVAPVGHKGTSRYFSWPWLAAAASLAAIVVSMLFLAFGNDGEKDMVQNTVFAPRGEVTKVALADGSTVWLRGGTRLSLPAHFGRKNRQLVLNGEAYFEVRHDATSPFKVITPSGMSVRVLGTHFEMCDFKGHPLRHVVLTQGSVVVEDQGMAVRLRPNEVLEMIHGKRYLRTVVGANYTAWVNQLYVADGRPLSDVFTEIADFYGKKITFSESVATLECSGKLDFTCPIDEVMRSIADSAPVKIEKTKGGYTVTHK